MTRRRCQKTYEKRRHAPIVLHQVEHADSIADRTENAVAIAGEDDVAAVERTPAQVREFEGKLHRSSVATTPSRSPPRTSRSTLQK